MRVANIVAVYFLVRFCTQVRLKTKYTTICNNLLNDSFRKFCWKERCLRLAPDQIVVLVVLASGFQDGTEVFSCTYFWS